MNIEQIRFYPDGIDVSEPTAAPGGIAVYAFGEERCNILGTVGVERDRDDKVVLAVKFAEPFDLLDIAVKREEDTAIKPAIAKIVDDRIQQFLSMDVQSEIPNRANRIARRERALDILKALYERGPSELRVKQGTESFDENIITYPVSLAVKVGNHTARLQGYFTWTSGDVSMLQLGETATHVIVTIPETTKCTSVSDMVRKQSICLADAIAVYTDEIEDRKQHLKHWLNRYNRIQTKLLACMQQQP